MASLLDQQSPAGSSRPTSPFDGIRAPSTMSVLKPSDFAKRKAAFMKSPPESTTKFHAELERTWTNPPSPLEVKDPLAPLTDGPAQVPRGTFVIPKLRSASVNTPASSTFLTPPRLTSTSLTASPESSPVKDNPSLPTTVSSSPKVEFQVLELNKQLLDTTVENKTLAAEISNMEKEVSELRAQQEAERQAAAAAAPVVAEAEATTPSEGQVPKADFDALVSETEKAAKELEALEQKAEERQKELNALADKAARLKSKERANEPREVQSSAKETLEQAVERLREQVEVATRQSSDVSRRMSTTSSHASERYGPSNTRIPIGRVRRAGANGDVNTPPATPPITRMTFDEPPKPVVATPSPSSTPAAVVRPSNRNSQVIAVAPEEALPKRDEIQRSIKSYYSDIRAPATPLPTINHSDHDEPSTEALSRDMTSIMEGFSTDFSAPVLALNTPPPLSLSSRPLSPDRSRLSRDTTAPLSPLGLNGRDSPSIRSKNSGSSLRGKKKGGWISLFKVKLPGGQSEEERRAAAKANSNKPPMLAPISQSTPLSL